MKQDFTFIFLFILKVLDTKCMYLRCSTCFETCMHYTMAKSSQLAGGSPPLLIILLSGLLPRLSHDLPSEKTEDILHLGPLQMLRRCFLIWLKCFSSSFEYSWHFGQCILETNKDLPLCLFKNFAGLSQTLIPQAWILCEIVLFYKRNDFFLILLADNSEILFESQEFIFLESRSGGHMVLIIILNTYCNLKC